MSYTLVTIAFVISLYKSIHISNAMKYNLKLAQSLVIIRRAVSKSLL